MIRLLSLLFLALVALPGCSPSGQSASEDRPKCQVGFATPSGFEPLETFEEKERGHMGVRLGFRDQDRREFYVAAGIPGEWGEGMAPAGTVTLRGGRTAPLLSAAEGTWLVRWDVGDPCDPRVVIGNGFSRQEFLELLAATGLGPSVSEPSPSATT